MAWVSRWLMICACCVGWLAPPFSPPLHAQDAISAADHVSDLVCPDAQPAHYKPAPNAIRGHASVPGAALPSAAQLGPLARTVIREQPLLHANLRAAFAPGHDGQTRRIAIWGDSHIAAGPFAPTLFQSLRERGLDVEAGFIAPTMGRAYVVLPGLRAYCIGSAWSTTLAYTAPGPLAIGPALADRTVDAGPESFLWLDVRDAARHTDVRQMQMIYRAPAGTTLDYSINDGAQGSLTLPATTDSLTLSFRADVPIATLKLRVTHGTLDLQGFILDRNTTPRVALDVFGIPSSTVKGWANADPEALAQSLHGVHYDAVMLEFGTNEGADTDFDADKYAAMLGQALGNLRQVFPQAACLLVGPPDRGVLRPDHGRMPPLLRYSHIHQQIEQIQRRVGSRFDCAAWNWQGLMGGPGGSYGWALARPSLMGHDLIHLSAEGYRKTGHALAHSLGWSP